MLYKLKSFTGLLKNCSLFWVFLFFISIFLSNSSNAQDKVDITGVVKDIDGNSLKGVSVTKKGTTKGSITDDNGAFAIKVNNDKATLVFSSVGYLTKELKLNSTSVTVVLEKSVVSGEDAVIIGYGQVKRKDITGSVATYKPKQNDAQQFNTVDNLLRGRVAGIQVTQSGGDPGGALSLKIRGSNSLRGDNEPLYVVDGVLISNISLDASDPFSQKSSNSGQTGQNALAGINPQDIESIEVLKDAAATAIYGNRGANGVVIITTKQGKGKPTILYSTLVEFSRASKKLNVLDTRTYATYINQIQAINSLPAKFGLDTLQEVFWQDELQQTGISTNNRLSISGASTDGKTKYFFAGGLLNNQGIVKNSDFKRGDLKFSIQQDLSRKLKLNFSLTSSLSKNNMLQSTEPLGGGDNSMIIKMLVASPIKNAQVDLTDPTVPFDNPLSWLTSYDDISEEKRNLATLAFTYKINNWLSYKLNTAFDYRTKERSRWFGKATFQGKNANGSLGLSQFERKFYQVENLFFINKRLKRKNQIDGTVGFTMDKGLSISSSVINENFFTEELRTNGFGFGQVIYPFLRNKIPEITQSVLGRMNYTLRDKYVFTVTGRYDYSSKFSDGNEWALFPGVAAAWKISEENFLKNSKLISNAKLRLGWGRTGSQAISPYATFGTYGANYYVNGNNLVSASAPLNIQNTDLTWETSQQINSGIDFTLFRNRISFTVDAYHKTTKDLLQLFAIPPSSGFNAIFDNVGSVENKGLEITVNALAIAKKDFTLNIGANIGFNRNKITDLGLPTSKFGINNWEAYIGPNVSNGTYFKDAANIFAVGQPIGTFYGYKTAGTFKTGENITAIRQFGLPVQFGDLKIVDQNKDGDITPDDKVILGDPNPKFVFGFNTSVNYKNFSLDAFFNGTYGNKLANGNMMRIGNANGITGQNILTSVYNGAWTAAKQTDMPRLGYNNLNFIDTYVEDASFLRMATLTFGYTMPMKNPKLIKGVNVNVTGKNLFTITKYTGFDPEVNSFSFDKGKIGVDWGSYPNMRSISVGLNFSF
jgi:TonB-dependent starch-binding outer membrane protein SusC